MKQGKCACRRTGSHFWRPCCGSALAAASFKNWRTLGVPPMLRAAHAPRQQRQTPAQQRASPSAAKKQRCGLCFSAGQEVLSAAAAGQAGAAAAAAGQCAARAGLQPPPTREPPPAAAAPSRPPWPPPAGLLSAGSRQAGGSMPATATEAMDGLVLQVLHHLPQARAAACCSPLGVLPLCASARLPSLAAPLPLTFPPCSTPPAGALRGTGHPGGRPGAVGLR